MTRVLSIWLPNLAVERWQKGSDLAPEAPVVLTVEGTHGPVIHAVTPAAAERGARAGARLTDARALDPALVAVAADPAGDAALVARLARWAGRWSPLVEVDSADGPSTELGTGLRLDIDGVAHLFGGERGLVADVRKRFAALGLTVRVAVAPTAGAAWALARYQSLSSARERDVLTLLAPLPVAALRLDADTVRTLERLGLKTIGALAAVPRLALARRFRGAQDVVDALDRTLGRKPEPLTGTPGDRPPRAALRLEEPATHVEAAGQALERLIPELVRQLQERHLGARRLALHGFRVDGSVATACAATTIASREPKHLQRLLADKAAALDPEFGFDAFALEADWSEALGAAQDSLVEEPSGERDLARLVDRLTVKLGTRAVRRPEARESHLPERASGWRAAVSSSPAFAGEGDRSKSGGGVLGATKNPSTILRMVPLPSKGWEDASPPVSSIAPKPSTSSTPRPRACRGGSGGGRRCMTLPGPKGRSGSLRSGGGSPRRRGCAIITGSRMPRGGATGSTARAWSATAAAGCRGGSCMGCSDSA